MPPLKYLKVKSYLEAAAVKPESAMRMPTVRELMNQFNVSLATVNRALSELENDGVIVRRQGSGIVAAGKHRTVARLQIFRKFSFSARRLFPAAFTEW